MEVHYLVLLIYKIECFYHQVNANPAYTQYMMERTMLEGNNCNPHSQDIKRHDPVYLTSMASHGVWQQQQQQIQYQQQQRLELQHQ
jgi:hypothetical protein